MVTRVVPASKSLAFVPATAACPRCGALVNMCEVRSRSYRSAELHRPTAYDVEFSCFICPEHPAGERWFTALPAELAGPARYTEASRGLVLSLVVHHKMSMHQAAEFARTHFHLVDFHPSTAMRWMRAGCPTSEELDARVRELAARFSGQLAVDEVYEGRRALIKATDPLVGVEIAYEFVEGPVDEQVMTAFFGRLRAAGIIPEVVNTDGAAFYPKAIAAIWPEAQHQSCVFHFLVNWTKAAMKALWHCHRLMPEPKKRAAGRPKKRGRPRADAVKKANRDLVRKARFLFTKRDENLTADERAQLEKAISKYAALRNLRDLVLAVYALFGPEVSTPEEARARRAAILSEYRFGLPFLKPLLDALRDDTVFERLIVSLQYENAERTTNHVERQNREFRKRMKSHYRMRTHRSRHALLAQMLFLPRRAPLRHPAGQQRLQPRCPTPTAPTTMEVHPLN
jgi:hypothetical protein